MRNAAATSATIQGFSVVLWLHEDPSPAAWAEGIETTLSIKQKVGANVSHFRSIVVTDGGAPNAAQRKELFEHVFEKRPHKLAVITDALDNPIKRGVATAITWLNPAFRALPTSRWAEALRHVDLESALPEILPVLRELQKKLPPIRALAALERAAASLGEVRG